MFQSSNEDGLYHQILTHTRTLALVNRNGAVAATYDGDDATARDLAAQLGLEVKNCYIAIEVRVQNCYSTNPADYEIRKVVKLE